MKEDIAITAEAAAVKEEADIITETAVAAAAVISAIQRVEATAINGNPEAAVNLFVSVDI
ncbi:hypothetical protein [Metabacillus fastidiosus]|uniref:hypothetical protein n=1 Tax=Metabacillus fastidiosus TaxID=1458 RepID=UPI002DBB3628|nr:hypothetical protein [Metabacillus fastidiosus]MEC2076893.1 hypothetical protein [Metabacillus fastidiosus]